MSQGKPERNASLGIGGTVLIGYIGRVDHLIEIETNVETHAEVIIGREVEGGYLLSDRNLVDILVDAAQHRLVLAD